MKKWLLILIIPLVLGTVFAYIDQGDAPTASQCYYVKSIGLTSNGYSLDADKIAALTTFDYDCAKNILGLWEYDFFISITDISGNYEEINSTYVAYGLWPGKQDVNNDLIYQVSSDVGPAKIPPYQQLTGYGISQPPEPLSNPQDLLDKTTPDPFGFTHAKTFSRLMLLEIDGTYKIVTVTLGVWK